MQGSYHHLDLGEGVRDLEMEMVLRSHEKNVVVTRKLRHSGFPFFIIFIPTIDSY